MPRMILTVGLPGSGKSTWAQEEKTRNPSAVIIERDEIRTSLFGDDYRRGNPDSKSEAQVSQVQEMLIRRALSEGRDVISSDTNLNSRSVRSSRELAREYGTEVEFEYFDVPVEECQRRNKARGDAGGRMVPPAVIDRMAAGAYDEGGNLKEFVLSEGGVFQVPRETEGMRVLGELNRRLERDHPLSTGVVIVDIDGTLAANHGDADRFLHHPEGGKKDYNAFFRAIAKAEANERVVDLCWDMREEGLSIVALTGRSDVAARELAEFIERSGAPVSRVIAKRAGDNRKDFEFKTEKLAELRDMGHVVVHAVDDRPQSIKVWEDEGIMVSKVDVPEKGFVGSPEVRTIFGTGACIRCGSPLKKGNIGPKCRMKP